MVIDTTCADLMNHLLSPGLDAGGDWLVAPVLAALPPRYAVYLAWRHIKHKAVGWQYGSAAALQFAYPNHAPDGHSLSRFSLPAVLWQDFAPFVFQTASHRRCLP